MSGRDSGGANAPVAPVIVRRRKVVAGGHHGGAWKVAYADFVTAMMAFFLLMWLLNATTEQQRKGLADYFAPDVPIARVSGGANGMLGGDSPTALDSMASDGRTPSRPFAGLPPADASEGEALAEAAETAALMAVEDVLLGRGGESLLSDEALRHVVTRLTDEGLVIEVFARPGAPLWAEGTAEALPVTRAILAAVARAAAFVSNPAAAAAYLPGGRQAGGGGWTLSTARADAARALLEQAGLAPHRMRRVTGHADRSPAAADPAVPRNDRIEITLLRRGR
ncbi:flagellar motor protein MotB [Rubellimicrobium sp. CFH 75288]|uniref:flagellar motor protein MotB n=1 Tax=Rubellimicrobium sp. CFH 75288 TaxID=2697034 RepID=UPI0014132487|nr:flagellar motor protein MotB [Rubellimicrobium sp. CFH 75288]NAZ37269.1 chemotaxis protein MotB [Rubellimicrobium sp. CFH 75288]